MWPVAIIGLVLAAAWGVAKLVRIDQDSDKILPEIKGRIHKVDWQGITFALDVMLKNPSRLKMYIVQPFLTITYYDPGDKKLKIVASSDVKDDIIAIEPFKPNYLKTIYLKAPYLGSVGVIADLLKRLQDKKSKETTKLYVVITTYILLTDKKPLAHINDYEDDKRPNLVAYSKTIPQEF